MFRDLPEPEKFLFSRRDKHKASHWPCSSFESQCQEVPPTSQRFFKESGRGRLHNGSHSRGRQWWWLSSPQITDFWLVHLSPFGHTLGPAPSLVVLCTPYLSSTFSINTTVSHHASLFIQRLRQQPSSVPLFLTYRSYIQAITTRTTIGITKTSDFGFD